jgi:hypothetical protein
MVYRLHVRDGPSLDVSAQNLSYGPDAYVVLTPQAVVLVPFADVLGVDAAPEPAAAL